MNSEQEHKASNNPTPPSGGRGAATPLLGGRGAVRGRAAGWPKTAQEKQKIHKRLLEKGDRNKMLRVLPQLHKETFAKIDCLACANCCRNYSPRFKQPDIKRIAKRLRIKEGELVSRYLKLDSEGDFVVQSTPCPFLGENNFCSIYEDRPSDCRRYPYTDEDVLLKRVALTLKNATVCPAVFTVLEALEQIG